MHHYIREGYYDKFNCKWQIVLFSKANIFWLVLGYIGEFELVDDHRAGKIVVELNGRLNKCGVISPRYDVGVGELEAWTARLLPSRQVSIHNLLNSVSQKIMFVTENTEMP